MRLEGRISGDPEFSGRRVEFTLDLSAADLGFGSVPAENKVLVYADPPDDLVARRSPPYFDYGDQVSVTGTLRRPEPFGGFDYPAYLARQGITGIMSADSATVTEEKGGWREWPYALRGRLSESIEASIPYPQSALGQALLLGRRGDLPPEMVQKFRSTGTSHLLAISGLHVGVLVVMFLAGSAWLFGRRGNYFLIAPLVMVWGLCLGFGTAAISGPGGGHGQRISAGGGRWEAGQHPSGVGPRRWGDDRRFAGDHSEGCPSNSASPPSAG